MLCVSAPSPLLNTGSDYQSNGWTKIPSVTSGGLGRAVRLEKESDYAEVLPASSILQDYKARG